MKFAFKQVTDSTTSVTVLLELLEIHKLSNAPPTTLVVDVRPLAMHQILNALREFAFASEDLLVTERFVIHHQQRTVPNQDGVVLMEILTTPPSITFTSISKDFVIMFLPEKEVKLKFTLEMDTAEEMMSEDLLAPSELQLSSDKIQLST